MNTVRNTPRFSRRTYGLFLTTILLFGCSRGNTGAVIATPTSIPSTTTLALANATSTQFAHPTAPAAIAKAAAIAIQPITIAIPNKMPVYVWVSKASIFLYAQPDKGAQHLAQILKDKPLELLDQSQDTEWLSVKNESGSIGWVPSRSVRLSRTGVMTAPTGTSQPAQGKVVTSTLAAAAIDSSAISVAPMACDASHWFFTPHPAETLRNFRVTPITYQHFTQANLYWFHDLDQTWVLFTAGGWTNKGGDINSVAQALSSTIGSPVTQAVNYDASVGDTLVGGRVTAYVSTADKHIVRWTIEDQLKQPLDWSLVNAHFMDCR